MARIVLSLILMLSTITRSKSEYNGDHAFTARWYRRESDFNWGNNDFGYRELVATTNLTEIAFDDYNGYHPDTLHLIPNEIINHTDYMGIHVFARCSPPNNGTYTFSVSGDDGYRFLSNGRILTNPARYSYHPFVEDQFSMTLSANEEYLWEIHFWEQTLNQGLHFKVKVGEGWKFVDSEWCTPTTLPRPIKFAGKYYRALDWTTPSSNGNSCQGDEVDSGTFLFHDVPVESEDAHALVTRFKFGASCLIVRSASSPNMFVALQTLPSNLNEDKRYCNMDGVRIQRTLGSLRVVGDELCRFRFLIQTDPDPTLPDLAYKYTVHSGVHSMFFKEALFATLRNTVPDAQTEGWVHNWKAFKLPPGYEIAPNDGLTRSALLGSAYTFGVDCVILADGIVQSTVNGRPCSEDAALDSTSIPGYYVVVGTYNAGVFIKDASGLREDSILSWDETSGNVIPSNITHLVQESGWLYGAVALTSPSLNASNLCQFRALQVPTGYSLVPHGDTGLRAVAEQFSFGTGCLVMSSGQGYVPQTGATCSTELAQATYNGKLYTATTTCPSLVMIRTQLPTHSPTSLPTPQPAYYPTPSPSHSPSAFPTTSPSSAPPTVSPSLHSDMPTSEPTAIFPSTSPSSIKTGSTGTASATDSSNTGKMRLRETLPLTDRECSCFNFNHWGDSCCSSSGSSDSSEESRRRRVPWTSA